MVNTHLFSGDTCEAGNTFLEYMHERGASAGSLHHIKSSVFEKNGYTYEYAYRASYLGNALGEPSGVPQIISHQSDTIPQTTHLLVRWLIKDNPTPGISSFEEFLIIARKGIEEGSSHSDAFPSCVDLEPVTEERLIEDSARQNIWNRFTEKMGLTASEFCFSSFAKWFYGTYIGFLDSRFGFDRAGMPIVFNHMWSEGCSSYLDVESANFVHVALTRGITRYENIAELAEDAERLTREIANLQKRDCSYTIDQRCPIVMADGVLRNGGTGDLLVLAGKPYAVDSDGQLFISMGKTPNHPYYTKGKYARCAGHISTDETEKIIKISNNSGHFQPHCFHLFMFLRNLPENVFHESASIELISRAEAEGNTKLSLGEFLSKDGGKLRDEWILRSQQLLEQKGSEFLKMIAIAAGVIS